MRLKKIWNYNKEERLALYEDIDSVENTIHIILKELKNKHPLTIEKIHFNKKSTKIKIIWG